MGRVPGGAGGRPRQRREPAGTGQTLKRMSGASSGRGGSDATAPGGGAGGEPIGGSRAPEGAVPFRGLSQWARGLAGSSASFAATTSPGVPRGTAAARSGPGNYSSRRAPGEMEAPQGGGQAAGRGSGRREGVRPQGGGRGAGARRALRGVGPLPDIFLRGLAPSRFGKWLP